MQIQFTNFSNFQNFGARKREIQTADYIQRKTKTVFPMLSPTYVDEFFYVADDECPEGKKKTSAARNALWNKVYDHRDDVNTHSLYSDFSQFHSITAYELAKLKENVAGNCIECAKSCFAVLLANGYTNSSIVTLGLKTSFINKLTGDEEYCKVTPLDHSFVVTDLNKEGGKDIIIDTWLDFADFKSEAAVKFRNAFEEDIEKAENDCLKGFMERKTKAGEEFDPENYKKRSVLVFLNLGYTASDHEKALLGEHVKEMYPESLINKA